MRQDEPRQLKGINSVEIGGRLLAALADSERPMGLGEVAKAADMSASKARRYLISFTRIGLVEQDSTTSLYDLSWFALRLGLVALSRRDVVRLSRPVIRRLREELKETTALVIWTQDGPTVVQFEVGDRLLVQLVFQVGATLPLLATAAGLVFGAFMPRASILGTIERELAELAKRPDTPHPRTEEAADRLLSEVRARGMARTIGSAVDVVSTLAAPIFNAEGQIIAALVLLGYKDAFDARWTGQNATALKQAANELSHQLGFVGMNANVKVSEDNRGKN